MELQGSSELRKLWTTTQDVRYACCTGPLLRSAIQINPERVYGGNCYVPVGHSTSPMTSSLATATAAIISFPSTTTSFGTTVCATSSSLCFLRLPFASSGVPVAEHMSTNLNVNTQIGSVNIGEDNVRYLDHGWAPFFVGPANVALLRGRSQIIDPLLFCQGDTHF